MTRDARRPLRLDSLSARMFVAIAEEGSIAKAAARENIVASAFSKRLSDLEAHFGLALVKRDHRGVTLTPAGEALAYHARLVLEALGRMQESMAAYIDGVRGHVRICASASALSAGLPADLQDFMHLNEDIRIEIVEHETPAIVQQVLEGSADVGIGPDIFREDTLQLLPYRSYHLAMVVPGDHPLSGHETIAYTDTLGYEQVEASSTSALGQLLDFSAKQATKIKKTSIRVRNFEAVCTMIAHGMGIGVVPSFLAESQGKIHGLRFIPLTDSWANPSIRIMIRDMQTLSAAAREFVTFLTDRATAETR